MGGQVQKGRSACTTGAYLNQRTAESGLPCSIQAPDGRRKHGPRKVGWTEMEQIDKKFRELHLESPEDESPYSEDEALVS
jgi:hypothetical protein